jgi:hypothetical protein
VFDGGHQWPPIAAYEQAIQWHELRNKKLNASEFFSEQMKNAKEQIDSGYLFDAYAMLWQLLPDFEKSKEAFTLDSQLASIQRDKRFQVQEIEVGKAYSKEIAMQREFRKRYMQHLADGAAFDPEYWKAYGRECTNMLEGGRYERLAGLRLIDFGWRLCTEQQYFFESNNQSREAAMTKKILDVLSTNGVKAR